MIVLSTSPYSSLLSTIEIRFHSGENLLLDFLVQSGLLVEHHEFILIEGEHFGILAHNNLRAPRLIGDKCHFTENIPGHKTRDLVSLAVDINGSRFYHIGTVVGYIPLRHDNVALAKMQRLGHHNEIGDFLLGQTFENIKSFGFGAHRKNREE